jgi:hypothetical protein
MTNDSNNINIDKDFIKKVRNNFLVQSDSIIANITDLKEIERWKLYRQQLRTFFDDKPDNFDYINDLIWPRTPIDIDALLQKAAEGDEEAISIIEKDNLNG